jgi:hypothetical protein
MADNQGLIEYPPGEPIIHPGGSLTLECWTPRGVGCGAILKITAPQGPDDQVYWAECPFCGTTLAQVRGGPPIIEVVKPPPLIPKSWQPMAKLVILVGGGIIVLILLWKIIK